MPLGPDDETPVEGTPAADESPTLVPCLACAGQWQRLFETETGHRMTVCRWCHRGAMSAKQIAAYHARSQGRP